MRGSSLISAFFTALFLVASAASFADVDEMEDFEKAIHSSFAQGDCTKLYDSLKNLLLARPDHPVSALYYGTFFQMADFFGQEKIAADARKIIDAVKKKNTGNSNQCLLLLNLELEKLLYQYDNGKGKKITDTLYPIRTWTLFGPYKKYGPGDLSYKFQPELISPGKDVSSQRKIHLTDSKGYIDIGKFLYPDVGIAYAQVSFMAAGPVKIRIYSKASYKVFINGKEAIKNVPENLRNVRIIKVWNTPKIRLLLKIAGAPFEGIRVLITDERDGIISPDINDTHTGYVEECDLSEELEFPYQNLAHTEADRPWKTSGYLARFFVKLGSKECINYFKKSQTLQKNELLSYLLASFLIDENRSDRMSVGYVEGWEIINSILSRNPDFIPAACKKLDHLIAGKNYSSALHEGKRLLARAPRHPAVAALLLRIFNTLQFEKEFQTHLDTLKKNFPDAVCILEEEAAYQNDRDKNKFVDISTKLLKRKFSPAVAITVFKELISRGDFKKAIEIINSYNNDNDFTKYLIEAYIKSGDLKTGRNLIIKHLLVKNDPSLYFALGALDVYTQDDPSMYFNKLLSLDPSNFIISDYNQYIDYGYLKNPFSRFKDPIGAVGRTWMEKARTDHPSTILYRGRIFLLQADNSSRLYCEDIISVNNEEGMKRWSRISIPYRSNFEPVLLRVYDDAGNTRNIYNIDKNKETIEIKINALHKNSVIHLAYIIDDPITDPHNSGYFSPPAEYLQSYDEPVNRISVKVIAPEKMKVHFLLNRLARIIESRSESLVLYSLTMDNLPPIKKSNIGKGKPSDLFLFSFSTMESLDDFVRWYTGLVAGKTTLAVSSRIDALKKDTPEKTAAAVYNFVAREITLKERQMYSPEKTETVLYRNQGSIEDKVLLARALFEKLGFRTFVAFARNKNLPDTGQYISPDMFTHILLFVPLDIKDAIWLDFSEPLSDCCTIQESIGGTDALVIVNETFRIVKVKGRDIKL